MNIIFFGTDSFVISVLETVHSNFKLVAVVTAPDGPQGRKRVLTPSPIKRRVLEKGITVPIFTPKSLDQQFQVALKKLNPDVFVLASYGKILPDTLIKIPKAGSLNIHPSLLPKYRGASPVPTTILNGDKETGVTIIKMDDEMDHGPIVATKKISLTGKEDLPTLINKLFQEGARLLVSCIPDYVAGKTKLVEQNHTQASFTSHIKKEDGYFEIDNPPPPDQLDRMIRAYYPWPTAWTRWSPSAKASGDKKGKIIKLLPNQMVQMEGKKVVSLQDFLNGYPDFPLKEHPLETQFLSQGNPGEQSLTN